MIELICLLRSVLFVVGAGVFYGMPMWSIWQRETGGGNAAASNKRGPGCLVLIGAGVVAVLIVVRFMGDRGAAIAPVAPNRVVSVAESGTPTSTPTVVAPPTKSKMAITTVTPSPTIPAALPMANASANLRAGPGIDFDIVGGVSPGEVMEVVGQNTDGTWLQLASGAWIAASLVDGMAAATSPAEQRCVLASEEQLYRIRVGVKDIAAGNDIRAGWAVRSNDFSLVWMVAAKIYGQGMEDGVGPGVWAISGEPNNPGLTLSVNGFAKEFSSWGDGSQTDAAVTIADDGVAEAIACSNSN